MNKRHLHHAFTKLRLVRYWYLIGLVVISGTIFVFAYRQNNLEAIHLRDVLVQADKDNTGVEAALNDLRQYTYSHMNTNLSSPGGVYPPIQLKYTYERLVAAEKGHVDSTNSTLYTDAQNYCEQQITSRKTTQRVPCINAYLADHSSATIQGIPDALYKFDFVAPAWSPDLAGWSLIITIVLLIGLAARTVIDMWMRAQLRE